MPSTPKHSRESRRVELWRPAPHHAERPGVHLDETDETRALRDLDELVREVRHAVDVDGPRDGGNEDLDAVHRQRLERREKCVEQLALLLRERGVKVVGDHLLLRAVAQTPGKRLRIPERRRRIGERARVFVDPEREHGCLEQGYGDLPLGKNADKRRRQGAVIAQDDLLESLPGRTLALVMIEEDDVDPGSLRDSLQLAEPGGIRGLHDDQPIDRLQIEAARLHQIELLGMEPRKVADVAVERPGQRNHGPRIEPPACDHRGKGVEVGIRMSRDDVHEPSVGAGFDQAIPVWGPTGFLPSARPEAPDLSRPRNRPQGRRPYPF